MDLLNPAALWWLLLAAVLLLLARNRTARPRRPVANLYLWAPPAPSAPAQLALRRLRRHWLVMLQAAIIAVIVFALARPLVSWRAQPVALIVDVSSSMGARDGEGTRLDLARHAARAALDALPGGARVRLVAAGAIPTDLGEFAARDPRLRRAIDGLSATAGSGDLARAIRTARTLAGEAAAVLVFSDGYDPRAADDPARWITIGHPAGNQAITSIAARRLPANPGDGQVVTTVWNHAAEPVDTEVEITQEDRIVARQALHLEARRSAVIVTDVAGIGGVIHARLTTTDALAVDDERATVVAPLRQARVRLVTPGSFFLERALETNPSVALQVAAPDDAAAPLRDSDILVCDRCGTLPAAGRAVLMIPAIPKGSPAPMTISQPGHPIASLLDVGGVLGAGASLAPPPAGAEIVLRAGPDPALVAYEQDGRRVVELRLDVDAAGFPLSAAFPVLLDNVLAWLGGRGENAAAIVSGEPLRWRLPAATLDGASIIGPDGRPLNGGIDRQAVWTTETDAVGIYGIHAGVARHQVAVNAMTEGESDLAPADAVPPSAVAAAQVAPSAIRTEAGPLLLLLAVVLLMLEWEARVRGTRAA